MSPFQIPPKPLQFNLFQFSFAIFIVHSFLCLWFRFDQKKPCCIYRLIMDISLEQKIFDRQIGKQAIADQVVDELNPDAHLTSIDLKSLVCNNEDDPPPKVFGKNLIKKLTVRDPILGCVLEQRGSSLTEISLQPDAHLLEGKDSLWTEEEKETSERLYDDVKMATVASPPRSTCCCCSSSSNCVCSLFEYKLIVLNCFLFWFELTMGRVADN